MIVLILLGSSGGVVVFFVCCGFFSFFLFFVVVALSGSGVLMKSFHLSCLDGPLPQFANLGIGRLFSCILHAEVYTVISIIGNTQKS